MTEALLAVQARIGEIQRRFAPQPAGSRGQAAGADFAAALATAQGAAAAGDGLDGLQGGSTVRALGLAGGPDLGGLGGLAGLDGIAGLGSPSSLASLPSLARAGRPGPAPDGAGADAIATAVLAAGQRYLGVPYRWGGTDPTTGLDCSGFVQRVFRDVGVELPRVSRDQAGAGQQVAGLDDARPGDLVAFGSPVDHIGIYAGDGQMLVAPRTGDVVKLQSIYRTPTAIRRVLPGAGGGTGAAPAGASLATPRAGGERFAAAFAAAEAAQGLPPGLLRAVAAVESGFDPAAASGAGAQGLMQLMPATARALGVDPLDPEQAIDGAARLLAGQLDRFGSLDLALAAYNAGGPAVARAGGIPPYPETRAYVARVRAQLSEGAS